MNNKSTMKKKINILVILLALMSTASMAQYRNSNIDSDEESSSYLKIGTQIPFQHSIIYDHRITPAFSINAGLGFITAPYTGLFFSSLEGKESISSSDRDVLDRSYQFGLSYQLGANVHFEKNYVRLFGQLAHLNGDLAVTDLANLYLQTNIPPIAGFLNPIDIRSNIPMIGLLFGRKFPIGVNSEIHLEASLSKTLGHNTTYKTNTFIDNLGFVNDLIYSELDNDLDSYFRNRGWIPSVNVYYVFKL
jgi:hypothetical protein